MKVYELKVDEVFPDYDALIKVLDIRDNETTIFMIGPDVHRIERGPTDAILRRINAIVNVSTDFDSFIEYRESQDAYWSSEHPEVRIVSARIGDKDFDPSAVYASCMSDEYMLDQETGELWEL